MSYGKELLLRGCSLFSLLVIAGLLPNMFCSILSGSNPGPPDNSPGPLSCRLIDLAVRKLFLILRLLLISLSLFQLIGLIVFPLQELSLHVLSPPSPQGNLFLLAVKDGQAV